MLDLWSGWTCAKILSQKYSSVGKRTRARRSPNPRAGTLTAFQKVVANPSNPLLWVMLSVKERKIPAIVDTGAQFSCIRSDVIEYLYSTGLPCSFLPCHLSCLLADGTLGQISNAVKLHVGLLSFSWDHEFKILNEGPFPAILGLDFLQRTRMTVDLPARLFGFAFAPNSVGSFSVGTTDEGQEPFLYELCTMAMGLSSIAQVRPEELNPEVLRDEYPQLFTSSLGTAKCTPYQIELSDNKPVRSAPYRCAPPKLDLQKHCERTSRTRCGKAK